MDSGDFAGTHCGVAMQTDQSAPLATEDIVNVPRRLDLAPVTVLHWTVMAVCALGFTLDLLEIALGSALTVVFSAPPYSVPAHRLSWLLASVYFGAIIGAPLLGLLADRHGRRAVLSGALLLLGGTSVVAGFSPNFSSLGVIRGISGLALGAYPPLMIAYLTDIIPANRRGLLIMITVAVATLGPPIGILFIRWLSSIAPLGLEAWRWAFLVFGVGSSVAGALFLGLPESPRWLFAMGRHAEAEATCGQFERSTKFGWPSQATRFFATNSNKGAAPPAEQNPPWSKAWWRRHYRSLGLIATLDFLGPWGTVGFTLLSGAVLIEKGFRVSDSLLYVGISTLGQFVGTVVAGFFLDSVERRTILWMCATAMAALGMLFAVVSTPLWLVVIGLGFSFVVAVYLPAITIYAAELFPTASRASTTSTAWAVNRVASSLVPLALLPLLHSAGAQAMFAIIASAMIATVVLVVGFGPRGAAGRPID